MSCLKSQSLLPRWFVMIPFRPDTFVWLARLHAHGSYLQEQTDSLSWPLSYFVRRKAKVEFESFLQREVNLWRGLRDDVLMPLGLASSVDQTDYILRLFDSGTLNYRHFQEMQAQLFDRIQDDLRRGEFFMIPAHKRDYYTHAATQFGDNVNKKFPGAQNDIESASKCFAFGRYTAVVFHLMRAMELGLRALGNSLNDTRLDPKRNPTWDTILRRCDDELKLPLQDRSVEWKTKPQFYCDATANLRAVKDAWRNPTMHVEREYDEDQALDVLSATRGFMRHLATELSVEPLNR
jgi:hypothetical protein